MTYQSNNKKSILFQNASSNIPGYCGHTPQLKFNCGHTYGYHTNKLTEKHLNNKKILPQIEPLGSSSEDFIPEQNGDTRYVKNMVSSYTGYIPQKNFKYGETHERSTQSAIGDFRRNCAEKKMRDVELINTRTTNLVPISPPKNNSHPGLNLRPPPVFTKQYKVLDVVKSAIPGYGGYVPRNNEHKLGSTYSLWTRNAYEDANSNLQRTKYTHNNNTNSKPEVSVNSMRTHADVPKDKHSCIYNQRLGMLPKYTGYIPQRRFDTGCTYGDSTRELPVCKDARGYANGEYNQPSYTFQSTVIPVRM